MRTNLKKDDGLDAYAPPSLSGDRTGRGVACSTTPTISKVSEDAKKAKEKFPGLKTLIFVTSGKVSRITARKWAKKILKDYELELQVVSREDIITTLMLPENASICATFLNIDLRPEPTLAELIANARQAAAEIAESWAGRLKGQPLIELRAERLEQNGAETGQVFSLGDVSEALRESRHLVLEAPAGRGKTTTLVQLARGAGVDHTALMVDLPQWVDSGRTILEYLGGMREFLARRIGAAELARVCQSGSFWFLLNGWNEITASNSVAATNALRNLERAFPEAGIIVATRTHHLTPPLSAATKLRLLPLTRRQRAEYLTARLGGDKAQKLQSSLDAEPVLDELTRTPFILSEVTRLFEAGAPIPKTKIGVLGAVIRLQEEAQEHRNQLQDQPLFGVASAHLEALATEMTRRGGVSLPDTDARAVVSAVSAGLLSRKQIERAPEPSDVLAALTAHHVLERTDYPVPAFRFGHQQFQEYYATIDVRQRLLRLTDRDSDGLRQFTAAYVNEPAWEEPLRMIAETLNTAPGDRAHDECTRAGTLLVEMALGVDPVFAGELARACGKEVWRQIAGLAGKRLRAWHAVDDGDNRDCALAAMIATGSSDFRDILVPLLASSDQQVRLRTYRVWADISLDSLGPDWRKESPRGRRTCAPISSATCCTTASTPILPPLPPRTRARRSRSRPLRG